MTNKFQILNNFKGFGNPSGDFWFVGIEESLEIKSHKLDEIVSKYNNDYIVVNPEEIAKDQEKFGKSYTKVYDIMSKIIAGSKWKEYKNERLLQKKSNEFQMNLYPLGKKSTSIWPLEYNKLFSFNSYEHYEKKVQNERFLILKEFWKKCSPQITICFGISYIDDFIQLFDLMESSSINICKEQIHFYKKERILITPFFDNRNMGWEKIYKIRDILNNLAIRPYDKI